MLKLAQLQAQPVEMILSKHLPESSGYAGNHVIDLGVDAGDFRDDLPELTYVLDLDADRRAEIATLGDPLRAMTLSCWVRPLGRGAAVLAQRLVPGAETSGGAGFALALIGDHFALCLWNKEEFPRLAPLVAHSLYRPGVWSHLAVAQNSDMIQLYVNGLLDTETPGGHWGPVETDAPLRLGGRLDIEMAEMPDPDSAVQLDEVRLWNVMLGAEQIRESMYGSLTSADQWLVGAWKAGSDRHELPDGSPHRRHGTLHGARSLVTTRPDEGAGQAPALLLIEKYRLSVFPGRVGRGRVVKTFSLLPGERTKLSMSTFTKTEQERKEASSILDSHTDESEQDFQNSVEAEQSAKTEVKGHVEAYAELSGEATWGAATVRGKAGMKASVDAARDDFSKNVSNALQKHAARASRKRDVQINTSYEVKEETSVQTASEREIENINLSRTLNFVFRQMTQEFIALLHLVDVRIGAVRAIAEPPELVPISELDDLLERYVEEERRRAAVRKDIIEALTAIRDVDGELHKDFIRPLGADGPEAEIWTVNRKLRSSISDEPGDEDNQVQGVIVGVERNVMRMEAVTVEASLGEENALDDYSIGLQLQAVREQELRNDLMATERNRQKLLQRIVETKDQAAAELFWRSNQPTLGDLLGAVVDLGRGVLANGASGDGAVRAAARPTRARTSTPPRAT